MAIDITSFLRREMREHRQTLDATLTELEGPFTRTLDLWERCLRGGGKLLLFGNGGSAADAQHIAAELVVRYRADRIALAAVALAADGPMLTACGNDLGFESIFLRSLQALGRPGDVAVGLSTSGHSPNVLAGLRESRRMSLFTSGFTGAARTQMAELCDTLIVVPSHITARVQEMHITIGHMLCKALEQRLGLSG